MNILGAEHMQCWRVFKQLIVIEVEAIQNNCPLNYASSDINDPKPITPAHLL